MHTHKIDLHHAERGMQLQMDDLEWGEVHMSLEGIEDLHANAGEQTMLFGNDTAVIGQGTCLILQPCFVQFM